MDNLGHRENGRQRPDQFKAVHTQVGIIHLLEFVCSFSYLYTFLGRMKYTD
jgi:hypothetical protein